MNIVYSAILKARGIEMHVKNAFALCFVCLLTLLRRIVCDDDNVTSSSTSTTMQISSCAGYIQGLASYNESVGPYPIECGSSVYGDRYGPKEYQHSSCCSGDGRYFVQTGQIGGFDYEGRINDAKCFAYVDALSGLLCDPKQGNYVVPAGSKNDTESGSVFRICASSCNEVFDACGRSLQTIGGAKYSNGSTLCHQLWGGFGFGSPCDKQPLGFPCKANLKLEIIADNSNCLNITTPSRATIDQYKTWGEAPSVCDEIETGAAVLTVIGLFLLCLGCCGCCLGFFFVFVRVRRGSGSSSIPISNPHRRYIRPGSGPAYSPAHGTTPAPPCADQASSCVEANPVEASSSPTRQRRMSTFELT